MLARRIGVARGWTVRVGMALAVAALVAKGAAQDGDEDTGDTEEPAQPAAPAGPPTVTGRDSASGSAGQLGMIFELGTTARLVVPPGLPIGNSRRMSFGISRQAPRPADVVEGFRRIGPVMSFDGAIDASRAPVVVSIRQPRDPVRPGHRLVLAMEQPSVCTPGRPPLPGGAAGLCSGWELIDARWENGRLSADLRAPGGFRLTFGQVPVAPASP